MRSQPPQGVSRVMAERESNGRFAKGNSGGPGNPFAAQVAKLRAVVLACLDEETMRVVVQAMIRQAMRGDVAAAKLLFQYSLGKPIEVPLPEAEEEEVEEEAVNKREETASAEQAEPVSKREETAARTESKRKETVESVRSGTVNKRRETGQEESMNDDARRRASEEVRRMLERWLLRTGAVEAIGAMVPDASDQRT